jgi:hypothetical protein
MAEPGPPSDGSDGSMETILASIRRIISEDEAVPPPTARPAAASPPDEDDDLLVLQPSMMVPPKAEPEEAAMPASSPSRSDAARLASELAAALFDDEPDPVPVVAPAAVPAPAVATAPVVPPAPVAPPVAAHAPEPVLDAIQPRPTHALPPTQQVTPDALMAPQTRAAAAQSLAALHEMVRGDPTPAPGLRLLRNGGPTIEDMVREELRLQLKDWLDSYLPELVERLVRQEIERLVRPG